MLLDVAELFVSDMLSSSSFSSALAVLCTCLSRDLSSVLESSVRTVLMCSAWVVGCEGEGGADAGRDGGSVRTGLGDGGAGLAGMESGSRGTLGKSPSSMCI